MGARGKRLRTKPYYGSCDAELYNHERSHRALDNLTPAKVYEWGATVRAKGRVDRCDGGG